MAKFSAQALAVPSCIHESVQSILLNSVGYIWGWRAMLSQIAWRNISVFFWSPEKGSRSAPLASQDAWPAAGPAILTVRGGMSSIPHQIAVPTLAMQSSSFQRLVSSFQRLSFCCWRSSRIAWSSAGNSAIADSEVLSERMKLCSGLTRSFGLLSGPHFGKGTSHVIVSLRCIWVSLAGVWASPVVIDLRSDERECGSGSPVWD